MTDSRLPPPDAGHAATSADVLARLADTLESRLPQNGGDPSSSYVAKLMARGPDAFLKKIGEEATELVMAAKDNARERIVSEAADLWFHSMVALAYYGVRPEDVTAELARREGTSGLVEKANRQAKS
jgi:phosphoribosyl-ATP pyrophosphohydrolase